MAGPKLKIEECFDKELIRSKIRRLTHNEARRLKGPIYSAMIQELHEAGCHISAQHFLCVANKESKHFLMKAIRDRVSDEPELLNTIFDNIKAAECAAHLRECGGMKPTFELLYATLKLLEPYGERFDVVQSHLYQIICTIAEKFEGRYEEANELIARIYHKYGSYLVTKGEDTPQAIKYLEKALNLARGNKWLTEVSANMEWAKYESLHFVISRELSNILLKYSTTFVRGDIVAALGIVQQAIIALAEGGLERNRMLIYRANLKSALYLMDNNEYKSAIVILMKIENAVTSTADCQTPTITCDLYLNMGICLTNLNDDEKAKFKLRQTLTLSRLYGMARIEAEAQLNLGKLYSKKEDERLKAKKAFQEAKKIFSTLGDKESRMKTGYLLAKLKSDKIFPYFLITLKSAMLDDYCSYYSLYMWKNRGKPYWPKTADVLAREKNDLLYCLLEEGIPRPKQTDEELFDFTDPTSEEHVKSEEGTKVDEYTKFGDLFSSFKEEYDMKEKEFESDEKVDD